MALCAARCSDSFLLRPPGGGEPLPGHFGRDLKTLAVVGAFFVEQLVDWRHAVFALSKLLQLRLVVAAKFAGSNLLDFRIDMTQHKFAGRSHPAV